MNAPNQLITKLVMLAVLIILALYNIWIVNNGSQQTISGFIKEASTTRLWIPLLVGFVCGHLFWSEK